MAMHLAVAAVVLSAVSLSAPALAAGRSPAAPRWHVIKQIKVIDSSVGDVVALPGGSAWVSGETPGQTPELWHLHGGHWSTVGLPGGTGTFAGQLSATTTKNVWVTLENEPDVAHLTHRGWLLHSFAIGSDDVLMNGVVTLGASNVWAFSYDTDTKLAYANHYNGSKWISTTLPAGVDGNSLVGLVSASSPSDIWTLASTPTIPVAAMYYNGHKWAVTKLPPTLVPPGHIMLARQILALSPTDVWATIFSYEGSVAGPIALVHWNGHRWHRVRTNATGYLTGPIASDGQGGLWLTADTTAGKPYFLHYHPRTQTWAKHVSPPAGGPLTYQALALIPGTHHLLGVAIVAQTFGATRGSVVVKY
jgi:hypothetical protein